MFTWNDLLIEILNMDPDERKTEVEVSRWDNEESDMKIESVQKFYCGLRLYPKN